MGWQEDWGFIGSSGEKDLGPIEYIEGVGHRRAYTNSEGQRVYRGLTQVEQSSTGKTTQSDITRAAEDKAAGREERLLQHQEMLQAKSDERFQTQITQQNAQFQASLNAQLEQARASTAAQLAGIANQSKSIDNANALGMAQLGQQGQQHKDVMAQQTRQLELNNDLLRQKLGVEDRHFQQQMALDERNARRTKVLGSLTLIAQSLQRL